ncbi:tyrosine-type recombinase/integrase [Methanoplanus limicola]|uniref:Integrase family protein n=1 Tax=Methanoplanus limicola DSM 2279 TaxID=937775 RepID=H1Z1A2_9EURY|nr:site-specific integrase [Methanoplanus limicola]EHQ35369.1 integrase family protein [Methanoplanus limicola DSM 2279]
MEHKSAISYGGLHTVITSGEQALTRQEYDAVLAACECQEDRVLIMLGVSLGLRRADLVSIKISDIDLNSATMSYAEKKKGSRIRTVPISPKLLQEIKILLKTIPKKQKTLFSFKERQAYNRFQKLCNRAGVPGRPIHALRATCVKFCQAAGWTPEQVSRLTGDTIRVIQLHYATPSAGEMADVVKDREIL